MLTFWVFLNEKADRTGSQNGDFGSVALCVDVDASVGKAPSHSGCVSQAQYHAAVDLNSLSERRFRG